MLLPLVLEQLGLAGVLFVAPLARLRVGRDAADGLRERRIRQVGRGHAAAVAQRQIGTRVVFQDVSLSFAAALVHFLAVLAVVIACRS